MSANSLPDRASVGVPDHNRVSKTRRIDFGISVVLAIIFASGTLIRFLCIGWDGFSSLHPDERHMIFAVSNSLEAIKKSELAGQVWPLAWFSLEENVFNPRRAGFFYVYGDLPHNATAAIAYYLKVDGWPQRIMLGRLLVSGLDSFAILVVFFAARSCNISSAGCVAAALLYAVMPLSLQHAGFFVVDGPGVFFTAVFLLAICRWASARSRSWNFLAGLALAGALACKISFLALLALVPIAVVIKFVRSANRGQAIRSGFLDTAALLVVASVGFRVLNPSAFSGPGFLDVPLSKVWIEQLMELSNTMANSAGIPSGWQWTVPGVHLAAFRDLGLWGFGPAVVILVVAGLIATGLRIRRTGIDAMLLMVAFVTLIAVLLATQAVPAVRYALPVTPALAALGGFGFAFLMGSTARFYKYSAPAAFALMTLAVGWGGAVAQLHILPNTRISASIWLEKNLPYGATIARETDWDDALPVLIVRGQDFKTVGGFADHGFQSVNLGLTNPDEPAKAGRIAAALAKSDVLVMSSDRQFRTMSALSTRFPLTTAYFDALFRNDLCFKQIANFERRFNVFGLDLDDSEAQEIWRVYDHPPVWIFRKETCFDETTIRTRLESILR